MSLDLVLTTALALLLALAAWSDLRTRRIPNLLTVPGICLALVLHSFAGSASFLGALGGLTLAFAVGLLLLATGGIGGGDAKLLMLVGAFLGAGGFLLALAASAVLGGAMALLWSVRYGVLGPTLQATGSLALFALTGGRHGTRQTLASPGALAIPYGVAIAAGAFAVHVV